MYWNACLEWVNGSGVGDRKCHESRLVGLYAHQTWREKNPNCRSSSKRQMKCVRWDGEPIVFEKLRERLEPKRCSRADEHVARSIAADTTSSAWVLGRPTSLSTTEHIQLHISLNGWLVGVEFNAPLDTV